jgi:phage tail-like protein
MAANQRPLQFLDYLPEVFRADGGNGDSFVHRFLKAFETLFEELQNEIEGAVSNTSGGIPDLFSPDTTPPAQFVHRLQADFDYLEYLAGWIALPLRADVIQHAEETEAAYATRRMAWNRQFFQAAMLLYPQRGTLSGMKALLRAWLKGELWEKNPSLLILTDLTRVYNEVDTVFQLAPEKKRTRNQARSTHN